MSGNGHKVLREDESTLRARADLSSQHPIARRDDRVLEEDLLSMETVKGSVERKAIGVEARIPWRFADAKAEIDMALVEVRYDDSWMKTDCRATPEGG